MLHNDEMGEVIGAGIAQSDAILLGRRTYLEFAELWPNLLWPHRTLRHSVPPNAAKLRGLKRLQRGEIPKISHPLQLVETAGIEPASAIA